MFFVNYDCIIELNISQIYINYVYVSFSNISIKFKENNMDTKLIESIIRIDEEKSITRAAEKLFITQSALNQQLQKLENELGSPLFVRTRSAWHPTAVGEVYLNAARQILNIKKDAYSLIQDITDTEQNRISIGLIPERGVDMFTYVYPEFHKHFPKIKVEPIECNVLTMQGLISRGEMNMGLITLSKDQKDSNTYVHMADEEIFLAIPSSHPLANNGSISPESACEISLSLFKEDPFILIFKKSTMYPLVKKLFDKAGFVPNTLFSTGSNVSQYRMILANVGCALLPGIYAIPNEGIRYYRLPERPHWEVTLCYRKDAYLSKAELYLIDLCKEYWSSTKAADI